MSKPLTVLEPGGSAEGYARMCLDAEHQDDAAQAREAPDDLWSSREPSDAAASDGSSFSA